MFKVGIKVHIPLEESIISAASYLGAGAPSACFHYDELGRYGFVGDKSTLTECQMYIQYIQYVLDLSDVMVHRPFSTQPTHCHPVADVPLVCLSLLWYNCGAIWYFVFCKRIYYLCAGFMSPAVREIVWKRTCQEIIAKYLTMESASVTTGVLVLSKRLRTEIITFCRK